MRNFYLPVLEWLEGFAVELQEKDPGAGISREFHFNFEYFNSTSAKYILDIFKSLNKLHASGKKIQVMWHYEEDDEDMLEVGREMERMARLPFNYVMIEV